MVSCSHHSSEVTVALSGTLDTFALPDVLRLLASTAKTGRLRITGDRGSGSVWVDGGDVVAAELASAVTQEPTNAEVVFGLLRFAAGSFTFEADAIAPNATPGAPLEPVLSEAENMLGEWRAIEEIIPSLDLWVGLRPALDGPDVMVDQPRWRGIAAIGSGAQVGAVAEALQMNEIGSCRLVKELLELGLVDFIEEPVGMPAPASFEPTPVEDAGHDDAHADDHADDHTDDHRGEPEALLDELDALDDAPTFAGDVEQIDVQIDDQAEAGLEIDDDAHDDPDAAAENSTEPSLAALASSGDDGDVTSFYDEGDEPADVFAAAGAGVGGDEELDPAEMARQLANLSPKAAKAVAAAARATTDAERDAALAAVEAEDDTVNRGLLLKFLGSVDS